MKLLVFHMHGCPHCRAVVGSDGLGAALKDDVDVYEIEASHPLCEALDVRSFPSFAVLDDDRYYAWRRGAPRTVEAFRDALATLRFDATWRP